MDSRLQQQTSNSVSLFFLSPSSLVIWQRDCFSACHKHAFLIAVWRVLQADSHLYQHLWSAPTRWSHCLRCGGTGSTGPQRQLPSLALGSGQRVVSAAQSSYCHAAISRKVQRPMEVSGNHLPNPTSVDFGWWVG